MKITKCLLQYLPGQRISLLTRTCGGLNKSVKRRTKTGPMQFAGVGVARALPAMLVAISVLGIVDPETAAARPAMWAEIVGARVNLSWRSTPSTYYVIQFRANLDSGSWSNRATVVATEGLTTWIDPQPLSPTQKGYYRLYLPAGEVSAFEPPGSAPGDPCGECSRHIFQAPCYIECTPYLYPFSGEFYYAIEDLRIRGRGLDFVWARKYRSRVGPNTAQGNGWDFSYNVYIRRVGSFVEVHDGNTRVDLLYPQTDGTYAAEGFFRQGSFNGAVFTLQFADQGIWEFRPLDGSAAQGKIAKIMDRNGNALNLSYDGQGRLAQIRDTLNRNVSVGYNTDGFIASVTDFTGRRVSYQYYQDSDGGGGFGDLKSVTSPAVTNTPNGNDFPNGKTTSYTYSKGLALPALNHNLLTITDPKGQTWLRNTYSTVQDPGNLEFDRVLSQAMGASNDLLMVTYVSQTPSSGNGYAVSKAILNDRVGNVSEFLYDAGNRWVNHRAYTGRAVPGLATTESSNRPTNPLRPADPPYFEARATWNSDSLLTQLVSPNGNTLEQLYESELNPSATPRGRGNLRQRALYPGPLGGDQPVIFEHFEYDDPWSGGCCTLNFVTRYTDGRTNVTTHAYDSRGNRTNTVHAIPSIVESWEYNAYGQPTAHVLPDNGSGHRRRDELSYYASGPQAGYLSQQVVDANGLRLTTAYEYDAVGNKVRLVDPMGHDTLYTYNSLDQLVRERSREITDGSGVRYEKLLWYDANNNPVRADVENRDGQGLLQTNNTHLSTIQEYEILNRPTRLVQEKGAANLGNSVLTYAAIPVGLRPQFISTEYNYDANRNPILVRYGQATAGLDTNNTVRTYYDERGLRFRVARAPGTVVQSTTQYDYDGNRNLTRESRGLEGVPRITLYQYDGYNRQTAITDPMGNIKTVHFDANGNRVSERFDGELNDQPGSAANVRLSGATRLYDAMNRLIQKQDAFFNPETQVPIGDGQATRTMVYSDNSQPIQVVDDNNHTNTTAYDTANRLSLSTDAKGNTTAYGYDANGNRISTTEVDRSDLGHPDRILLTQLFYDNLGRLVRTIDNGNATNAYLYDSRNNRVQQVDGRGNVTRQDYDGLNRLLQYTWQMTTVTGLPPSTVMRWDDSSRLIQQIDPNTNLTQYVYDSLNRKTQEIYADGTARIYAYDVQGNLVSLLDANGSFSTNIYDLLNRVTDKTFVPGSSVAPTTTFERYRYDGLGEVVRAEDDDSLVTLNYDSLANPIRETLQVLPGGLVRTNTMAYDGERNLLTCAYPGGGVVTTTYDSLDRKATISDGSGALATYFYLGPRLVERRTGGNGTRLDIGYDGVRRATNSLHVKVSSGTVLEDRRYSWDPAQNKVSARSVAPLLPSYQSFTYDLANRLIRSTIASSFSVKTNDYTLDPAGNRLVVNGEVYTMDPTLPEPADRQMNQYTTCPYDLPEADPNGNLTHLAGRNCLYDVRNRLVRISYPSSGTNWYRYDCLGRRIEKASGTNITRYLYCGGQEIEEQNPAGATLARYVWGNGVDELIMMDHGGQRYYYHADDLDSVFKITDSLGNIVEQYEYDDFGDPTFFSGTGAPLSGTQIGNYTLFTGRRYDPESGWYYFRSRYLDPKLGRFTSRDTRGIWADRENLGNGFTYVGNNPLSRSDPTGHYQEPRFRGSCSRSEERMIWAALGNAETLTIAARGCLQLREAEISHNDYLLYAMYFGSYRRTEYEHVWWTFGRVLDMVQNERITFDCDPGKCEAGWDAYVLPGWSERIYLCDSFWNRPLVGSYSMASMIVHELTHEAGDTDDHWYGWMNCLYNAESEAAVHNAANYMYFAADAGADPSCPAAGQGLSKAVAALVLVLLYLGRHKRLSCLAKGVSRNRSNCASD